MGLSSALWNSRYWLAGLHVLFLIALWISFLILVLIVNGPRLSEPGLFNRVWYVAAGHWYVPFLCMLALWVIAGLLAAQAPLELTRSDMADAIGFNKFQNRLENLCIARNIAVPKLYITDYPAINALIWGRDELRLYITKDACEELPMEQLEAVTAQQLGHLRNGDNHIFPIMYLFILMGCQLVLWALAGLGWMAVNDPRVLIGPFAVPLVILILGFGLLWLAFRFYGAWFGRMRRFDADLFAVQLSQNALALIAVIDAAKTRARMPIIPEEWRALAFLDPDPALTLPWYADPDDRIAALHKTLGMSMFGQR